MEKVWGVLHDFGDIQRWNPGVTKSALTSDGPVSEGSTRHCDFAPFVGVNERIVRHQPNERLTVDIYETFKLPISSGIADFNLVADEEGTLLTLHYTYVPNLLGRVTRRTTDQQLRKVIAGLARGLQAESERIAVA